MRVFFLRVSLLLQTTSNENTDFTLDSVSNSEFALKLERTGATCFVAFEADGQPVSSPCDPGLDNSDVETHIQFVLCSS